MATLPKITISDDDLAGLKDKVVVITGASSGIGLATAVLFASKGAKLVLGDVNPLPREIDNSVFLKTDVTSWENLVALFKAGLDKFGRIDTVFANAGITPVANYFDLALDGNGDPLKTNEKCLNINMNGCINTATLGLHYMSKRPGPGSIILTASGSSFAVFGATDYTSSKHAVVGFMRGLYPQLLAHKSEIRINSVAPSWTATAIVPEGLMNTLKITAQSPTIVAYSVGLLACDENRNCETIYSDKGEYREIDKAVMEFCKDAMTMNAGGALHGVTASGSGNFTKDWEEIQGLFDPGTLGKAK